MAGKEGPSMTETAMWQSGIGGPLFKMVDEVLLPGGIPPKTFLDGLRTWCKQFIEDYRLFEFLADGGKFSVEKPVYKRQGFFDEVTLTIEPVEEEQILGRLLQAIAVRSVWEVVDGRKIRRTGRIRTDQVNIIFTDDARTDVHLIEISTQKEGQQSPLQVQLPLSRPIFSLG